MQVELQLLYQGYMPVTNVLIVEKPPYELTELNVPNWGHQEIRFFTEEHKDKEESQNLNAWLRNLVDTISH